MNGLYGSLRKISYHVWQKGSSSVSMHLRLLGFLAVLVFILLILVLNILLLTGNFTAGLRETEHFYASGLEGFAARVEKEYGALSASSVSLSHSLSQSMELFLSERGISAHDLSKSPEVLEELLDREFDHLLFSLEKTGASGAFIVLDATVNNRVGDRDISRAGLYLKNMEPNAVNATSPTITVLRGFPELARSRGYSLHAQWDMEFNINQPPYFFKPLEKAKEKPYPLSRLYYWSPAMTMPQTSEKAMICAVPLLDSRGNVFGVCGYEVSAMLFKLKFMPDNTIYRRIFGMLALKDDIELQTEGALFSGSYNAFGVTGEAKPLVIKERLGQLFSYEQQEGIRLVGNHKSVKLYPHDAVFADTHYTVGLFMPQEDLDRLLSPLKTRLILLCILFLVCGIVAAVFISHKYTSSIATELAAIGSEDIEHIAKTNIREIDEIIEQIKARRRDKAPEPNNLFEDFIAKVKTLTPTEKNIFKYYAEGKTNNEILSLMYISLSTFKTHNSHIYKKLGISSRDELLLYVNLIKKSGCNLEIE